MSPDGLNNDARVSLIQRNFQSLSLEHQAKRSIRESRLRGSSQSETGKVRGSPSGRSYYTRRMNFDFQRGIVQNRLSPDKFSIYATGLHQSGGPGGLNLLALFYPLRAHGEWQQVGTPEFQQAAHYGA
jgi:hypothetical protein